MSLSQQYFEKSQQIVPGGVHSPVRAFKSVGGSPIFFKSAKGAHLTDVDGKTYIDFCMSFGPQILGHRDEVVEKAVIEQVQTAWGFGACEPYSLHLAEYIKSKISFVEKLRFVSSGTEAVMSALRIARAATKRKYILKFDGCYHGHVDSMLVKSGSGLAGESSSDSAGVSSEVAHETLVCELDNDKMLETIFREKGKQIAAVIIEPLPANYGLLIQREEFIHKMTNLAHENGALVIFDEVISGFRIGFGGMAEKLGIKPDLVTYGKILGGGFNVGCYAGKKELLDLVAPVGPVYQAGTLSANPIGMVAGLTTLKRIDEMNTYTTLEHRTRELVREMNLLFSKHKKPFEAVSFGSLFWVHAPSLNTIRSVAQIPEAHKAQFAKLFHACLEQGVYLAPSGYEVGFTSMAHTGEVLNETLKKVNEALTKF